jgi:tetratricopeptide (TPR) repeat protein
MRILATLTLLATCVATTASAPRPWTVIRGRSVMVIGTQAAKTLRGVALEIEQFRAALAGLLHSAGEALESPTVVYTFDNRQALEPFVPLYQGKPAVLGGFCHCGTGPEGSFIAVSLASDMEASRIIFHEYTHLLLRQATAHLPIWLNEGLAEYYSTFHLKNDHRQAEIGAPILPHVALLRRRYIPLAELVAVERSSALYNESERRSIFYAEAWALTHYLLLERPNGVAAVNTYITALTAGRPPGPAFEHAFGVTAAAMDDVVRQYVRRPMFRSVTYTLADRVDVEEPEPAQPIAPAEAEARLGIVQLRVGRAAEATARIEAAAAAGQEVAQAQLALGLLRIDQGRADDALAPLERAATLAPDEFNAQFTYALAVLRQTGDRAASDADPRERAYTALARAAAIHPRSAEALEWQAYAGLVLNAHIPEARAAITRAVALAPERPAYRLRLAEVCVRQGDLAAARPLLARLVAEEDADLAEAARRLLTSVENVERRHQEAAAADARDRDAQVAQNVDIDRGFRAQAYVTLRQLKRGEERAYGRLTQVDCADAAVRLFLKVGERTIAATAKRLNDIETSSFLDDKDVKVVCGARLPPDDVFMTWRPAKDLRTANPPVVGAAIAVEFVPKGAIPRD